MRELLGQNLCPEGMLILFREIANEDTQRLIIFIGISLKLLKEFKSNFFMENTNVYKSF